MIRPCFLVVDKEHPGSIPTRKLIIETAKFNVITAYGSEEAVETLKAFPSVHGAVLDGLMKDMPCGELIGRLHAIKAELPILVVGGPHCGDGVHHIRLFDPEMLLSALKRLNPEDARQIEERDAQLALKD